MTNSKPGDVILLPFPFTDLKTSKKRPALILGMVDLKPSTSLILVCMITAQVDTEGIRGDYRLKNWEEAGLLKPSRVRVSKMVTVESSLVIKKMGSLTKKDRSGVSQELKQFFDEWI